MSKLLKFKLKMSELRIKLMHTVTVGIVSFSSLYILAKDRHHVVRKKSVKVQFHMLQFCNRVENLDCGFHLRFGCDFI